MYKLIYSYGFRQAQRYVYIVMVTIAPAVAMDMIRNDKIVEITEQRQQKDICRLHEVGRERERECVCERTRKEEKAEEDRL